MLTLPDGRELPADLPGLLGHQRVDLARILVGAGVESTRHLLELSAEERRYLPGVGAARWKRIEEALAERHAVALGCLAQPAQAATGPPTLRALPGGRAAREAAAQAALDKWCSEG